MYYIGEYNAREGYGFSEMNQLIFNLKKPMDRRGRTDWRYKGEAIEKAARLFTGLIKAAILPQLTIVPMPSSKRKDHPDHDDRMLQVVRLIGQGREEPVDVRELLVQEVNLEASHLTQERPSIQELVESMRIDEALLEPRPRAILLVDDVITNGSHLRAAKQLLEPLLPGVPIGLLVLARRVPNSTDPLQGLTL